MSHPTKSALIGRTAVFSIVLLLSCGAIFYFPYRVLRETTIDALNQQQLLLASQASQGIGEFFSLYQRSLTFLASTRDIAQLNEQGKSLLQAFHTINQDQISAVTRVSADGHILYTVPFNPSLINRDISQQAHNAYIIEHHKPIVSDVFMAVQGYRTVAFAVPVFDREAYAGSLTILIPFDVLAKKYLESIRLGSDGYAWMLNQQGVELFCPVPGHLGKTIWETSAQFPSVTALARQMLAGKTGIGAYSYDRIREQQIETIRKTAAFVSIELPNTSWSIAVASPENYALSAISGFVKWWLGLFALVMIALLSYVALYLRRQIVTGERLRRLEAEEKLAKSERFFRQVINDAHIPFLVVDRQGTIELVNRKFEELYGYKREEIPDEAAWFQKAYPDESLRTNLSKIWEEEKAVSFTNNSTANIPALELPVCCKNGSVKEVLFGYTLIEDKLVISLTDQTQHNNLERERRELLQREEKARKLEMIGLLAGGVAHDLNNILSGVVSYPDLLISMRADDRELLAPLQKIKEAGLRAAAVVDDLLTAARGVATNKQLYEADRLLQEYLESPEHERIMAEHPRVEFAYELGAPGLVISCSPIHIKKSLMNLVANGAEAIDGSGRVVVSSAVRENHHTSPVKAEDSPGRYLVIRVADSGLGIPKEQLPRIFEPFYTNKNLGRSGSGLGLMVVQNSVEDHGGTIRVESSAAGTVFELQLPAVELTEQQAALPNIDPETATGAGEHIAVVDDEPLLQEIAGHILRKAGYRVTMVSSGEEAVELVRHTPVDLLLLDMLMEPGINGRETFARIRQIRPQQKALIVSGYSADQEVKRAVALGAGGLLKKPFTRESLLAAVRNALAPPLPE